MSGALPRDPNAAIGANPPRPVSTHPVGLPPAAPPRSADRTGGAPADLRDAAPRPRTGDPVRGAVLWGGGRAIQGAGRARRT